MEDFGKWTLDKDGRLDLEFSMEPSAFPPFNGFALLVEKVKIRSKGAVNSFNLSMTVCGLELGLFYNFILMENTSSR